MKLKKGYFFCCRSAYQLYSRLLHVVCISLV